MGTSHEHRAGLHAQLSGHLPDPHHTEEYARAWLGVSDVDSAEKVCRISQPEALTPKIACRAERASILSGSLGSQRRPKKAIATATPVHKTRIL